MKPAFRCPECWVFYERWSECANHLVKRRHSGHTVLGGSATGGRPDDVALLMHRCLARGTCVGCGKVSSDGWTATAEHGQPYYCEACWKLYDQK